MKITIVSAIMLAAAGMQFAQAQVTARQLWYQDDPEPKAQPAVKPPVKPDPARTKRVKKNIVSQEVSTVSSVSQPEKPASSVPVQNVAFDTMPAGTPYMMMSSKPLGLRYNLVRIVDGSPVEVSPDRTFHSGDRVSVRIESNRDGFLYVVARGSSGNWKVLFPSAEIADGDNRIHGRRLYQLPSGKQAFKFDDQAGQEQLFIVYSAQPVNDLDQLIYSLSKQGKPEVSEPRTMAKNIELNDDLVSRFRNVHSRDLLIDRAPDSDKDDSKPDNSVYVANQTGGQLVADIRLKHE